ncbi:glycosyltransferase family 2 protein [Gloeobacter morelensis]|nr:glycosyltransferase [Gloeobacter morelensis]
MRTASTFYCDVAFSSGKPMLVSVIVRTFNEERYLPRLLEAIASQHTDGFTCEVIVVDSGSTDDTVAIARAHGCRLEFIPKVDFSFGRSLNIGCAAARGRVLVFVSGHCIPVHERWLSHLVAPLSEQMPLCYGRQVGGESTRFSEHQLFAKFFASTSCFPQEGFFCNNANAALLASVWQQYRFDEALTGLEDMDLAKRLHTAGLRVGYAAEAAVVHHHHESWTQVRRRYEREAIALQHILPEVHISFFDFGRYLLSALWLDGTRALVQGRLGSLAGEIFMFRLMQFWGSYRGNHEHQKLSKAKKERYFYPGKPAGSRPAATAPPGENHAAIANRADRRSATHESP